VARNYKHIYIKKIYGGFVPAKYDAYFYKMCALMPKGDSFDADVLDVSDWNTRFGELTEYMKKVNTMFKQEKAIKKVIATLFFCDDVFAYLGDTFDYATYTDFVSLWNSALTEGFILFFW
jgi:hypothetical protein